MATKRRDRTNFRRSLADPGLTYGVYTEVESFFLIFTGGIDSTSS